MGWLTTTLRRSLLLVLIAAAGGALWAWRRDVADASSPAPPTWPPLPADGAKPGVAKPGVAMPDVEKPDVEKRDAATIDADGDTRPATPNTSSSSIVNALVDAPEARSTDGAAGGWAEPLEDGSCPIGYPIKANDNSGIFHLPDGRFYDRTKPERCYSDAAAALADGYRQAKN